MLSLVLATLFCVDANAQHALDGFIDGTGVIKVPLADVDVSDYIIDWEEAGDAHIYVNVKRSYSDQILCREKVKAGSDVFTTKGIAAFSRTCNAPVLASLS